MAVSNQQIIDYLLANPGLSDAQIVASMEQFGISPAQMANAVGIPEGQITARVAATVPAGQSVTLGDTIVQPQYQTTGSGMDQQVGGLENVLSYKVGENKVGGGYNQYTPTGELQRTGTQQKVDSGLKEFALGAGALFGAPYLMDALGGAAGTAGTAAGTAFDVANAGIAGGTAAFTPAELAAIGGGTTSAGLLSGGAGALTTGGATGGAGALTAGGTGALTTAGGAAGALTTPAATTGGLLTSAVPGAGTIGGALTTGALSTLGGAATKSIADAISGAAGTAGSLLQSQTSKEAAQKAASDINAATQAGVAASQFRPVGMTTRFGTSNYTFDPVTGQLTSAGYQLSPEAKYAQDQLVGVAGQGLSQIQQAKQQFAPLQTGAQNLFSLGNQYIQQSPDQVAQDYISKQMALLAPTRQTALANLANTLSNTGTTGLSVAQGGNLQAANPVAQAFANAQAMQDLQLAANAQQAGQQNVLFGAGLLGQGAGAMGQYYGGQAQAYQPYTSAMGQIQSLESAGQQPLQLGANLAQQSAAAGANAGRLGVLGTQAAGNLLTGNAATYNPYAGLLSAAGNPNSMIGQTIGNWLTGSDSTANQNAAINPYFTPQTTWGP
jgi:hypothetical protein